jgi:hypothetical protein
MKRSIQAVVCLMVFFLMTGCIYLNVQNPLDRNFNKTELGTKKGTSDFKSILWLFAWGDASTRAAAENGGIKVIKHADKKTFLLLGGLYFKRTTVVYGD